MSDIYSLLNINQGMLKDFRLLADRVADHQIEKVVKKNMSKLKLIESRMLVDKGLEVAQQSIDEVISKVIRMAPSDNTSVENWTIRELRIVSYYLMKLRDDRKNYMYALKLLDNNWKNMFFNGIAFYLLNSWHSIEPEYRTLTSQLLMRKLEEYSDSNRKYMLWKNRLNLFDDNGPVRMAAMLTSKKMSIQEAPTLLGFKETSIKQSYYSDVIIKYLANFRIDDQESIEEIFKLHNLDRTKKLLFANWVEKENRIEDVLRRAQLCRFASNQLGDVTLAATWAPFVGATETEAQKLKNAMKLVNLWFAQQIIESFFEICVQDRDRKLFWLNYVSNINAFKIIGSTATKRLLQSNSRIGGMFLRHFIETNSYSSQTSALVLFIKNKMIVEFSDTGALYVYNQTHSMVETVTNSRNGINSTNDLKITSMGGLVEKNYWGNYCIYNSEGKLHHRGSWQNRLSAWMTNILFSSNNTDVSFLDKENDKLFQAKPLPAENFKVQETEPSEQHTTLNAEYKQSLSEKETDQSEPNKIVPAAEIVKEQNDTTIFDSDFNYDIASKKLDHNVQILANSDGFYLSLGKNHYELIKQFSFGGKPRGSIWIKTLHLHGWHEIVHYFVGTGARSVGYIRITADKVSYKESLSVTDKKTYKLY